ncbi:MAG: hypothetical protein FWH57_09690 [Oscillospiraceae bacterium]|nr:hypothetical protein [Oscillospiraceae bacterium]
MKTVLKHLLAVLLVFCLLSTLGIAAFAAMPEVRTDAASGILPTSATLNGYITTVPMSGYYCYYGFEYCTNSSMIGATSVLSGYRSEIGSIYKWIYGLLPNTTYFYRAFVYISGSSGAKVYGSLCSFTTLSWEGTSSPSWWLDRESIVFPDGILGYGIQASVPTTVNNSGPGSLSGISATMPEGGLYFEITTSPSSTVAAGGVSTVSIRPKTGLSVGSYYGVLRVSSSNGGQAKTISLTFTVYAPAAWTLGQTSISFGSASVGYGAQTPILTTITNTGAVDMCAASASVTTGGQYFQITGYPNNTIPPGIISSFSVCPVTGLDPGTYSGTVTVSVSNGGSKTVSLSFTVTDPVAPVWSLNNTIILFPAEIVGNGEQASMGTPITNLGPAALSGVYATITSGASYFEITSYPPSTIGAGGYFYMYVRPRTGLPVGSYNGVLTVSTTNGGSKTVLLSFAVTGSIDPVWFLSCESMVFPSAYSGYGTQAPLGASMTNTGPAVLSGVNAAITSGATCFEITTYPTSAIGIGGYYYFYARPKTGLPAGTYSGVLTVSTASGGSKTISLSFTVTDLNPPTWSLSTDNIVFPSESVGYTERGISSVAVHNPGSAVLSGFSFAITTGDLYFERNGNILVDPSPNVADIVFLQPKLGLPVGTYSGVLTVSTEKDGSKTVSLSFTVTEPVPHLWTVTHNNIVFPSMQVGYAAILPTTNLIENIGAVALTGLSASITSGASYFEITSYPTSTLGVGGQSSVSVRPRTGLPIGDYNGSMLISTANGSAITIPLGFTVTAAVQVLALNRASITFPYVFFGYGTQTLISTMVNNTGTSTLSSVYATITTGATYFEIVSLPSTSIPAGGSSEVTVRPRLGLPCGLYSGVLTVSSSNGGAQALPLTFTVY